MNFSEPFGFPFEDKEWFNKLLIPGLIMLIPFIGGFYLLGWSMEITRQIIFREQICIPNTDFSKFTVRGLKVYVISLIYSLPMIVLSIPFIIAYVALFSSTNGDVNNVAIGGATLVSLCTGGLLLLYSLAMSLFLPASYSHFLMNQEEISAGLKIREIASLVKKAPVAYLLVFVGTMIASLIASLGSIACGIGMVITAPYAMLIMTHLYGQAYLEASKA